jgi:hypothetical protein
LRRRTPLMGPRVLICGRATMRFRRLRDGLRQRIFRAFFKPSPLRSAWLPAPSDCGLPAQYSVGASREPAMVAHQRPAATPGTGPYLPAVRGPPRLVACALDVGWICGRGLGVGLVRRAAWTARWANWWRGCTHRASVCGQPCALVTWGDTVECGGMAIQWDRSGLAAGIARHSSCG